MFPQYVGNVTLPRKPVKRPSLVAGPKKHKLALLMSIFRCIFEETFFSKLLALVFKYKVMMIYNCSQII